MLCLRAWSELETCRQIGMGLGAIPVTAILAWCAAEGFDAETTAIVRQVIRTADNQFLSKQAARQRLDRIQGR